ncbi:MAG TPA: fumarylacetoacetate hydrolase family protein [Mucilaginibacter sp.]|nr:fumarylacetoacetate hydrolase family protein [Mucilaginibacter sp.]
MKLYNTINGILLEVDDQVFLIDEQWDALVNRNGLEGYLTTKISHNKKLPDNEVNLLMTGDTILPPIGSQEVWAAGVTYLRSRDARMEESKSSGAASLYDLVYDAQRPELFFKATSARVSGHGQEVYIRRDSAWNVPEPELTLFINSKGNIQGYTIGNDMSSRSIEGENALYLPQAKIYEKSAAIGPCLYVSDQPIGGETNIKLKIKRQGGVVFDDLTTVSRIKRTFEELVSYLYAECDFDQGCYLMTGTCLVPAGDFTLQTGDVVEIDIDKIGKLVNTVAYNPKHTT